MVDISFDKIVDKVFDGFKKITPALLAITIVTGVIIFSPSSFLEKLGLNSLLPNEKRIIGVLFLLSAVLVITIIGSMFLGWIKKNIKRKILVKRLRKKFVLLPKQQKAIIVKLLKSPSKSIQLDSTSGDTRYLLNNGFIFQPEQLIDTLDLYGNQYIFTPQPWLVELFQDEPALFEISFHGEAAPR